MRKLGWVFFLTCVGVPAAWSDANAQSARAQVEVYDRTSGQVLPTYRYRGRTYVAGEPGHEYEVRIHSQAPNRVLAVTTVDGVNVITGQTGAVDQSGYVLDPYGFTRIEGWRKSMTQTAAFFFTSLSNSYAARTGRPNNVGVIGVALFREEIPCCQLNEAEVTRDEAAETRQSQPSPAAPSVEQDAVGSARAKREASKLGTGHGRREYSAAQYTEFQRASTTPDKTIVIYYDSYTRLVAQGVIPTQQRYAEKLPQPFPNGFVPDP